MFAEIAIPRTNLDTLTYAIPDQYSQVISPGSLVLVELKKKKVLGIVVDISETSKITTYTKEILEVVESEFLPQDLLALLSWVKKYYFANWGSVLNLTLPQSVYKLKPKFEVENSAIEYQAKPPTYELPNLPAVRKIINSLEQSQTKTFLLWQQTFDAAEIYLRLLEETLRLQKSAIVLVPEITLTPKYIARFQTRLGSYLSVFHSQIKLSARKQIWHKVKNNNLSVVLGTRSAIFLPIKNLGLIIVDDEHDISYKEQERHFHYHARDVAVMRAKITKTIAILASPTPSCESFYNAEIGKYELLTLPKIKPKIKNQVLLVDMRKSSDKIISSKLKYEIKAAYQNKQRTVLYLNRRGYARVITCTDCGYVPTCPQCGISLIYHRESFLCHICQHRETVFDFCPKCHGSDFRYYGIGTQKIESEIKRFIPKTEILRIDTDALKLAKQKIQDLNTAKIIIMTRLGFRELDFSQVNLFGVILADTTLFLPDFRSPERTFQELSNIIENCSNNKDCKVIIQSFHPDHYAIYRAVQGNYLKFYEQELQVRKKLNYPPFSRLATITIKPSKSNDAQKLSEKIANKLSQINNITVLGPSATPHPRKPQTLTHQILIKTKPNQTLANLINKEELTLDKVDIDINVDPT
ncbi:MAG: primosomal protein N' [candidate division WOR-3 bacterium]